MTMQGEVILHSDLDRYYASVEEMRNPRLRGMPFVVLGSQAERRGIVLAASYPAKRFRVKVGMARWEVKRLYPKMIFIKPRHRDYMQISGIVHHIYRQFTDKIQPFGIDEAWLHCTGSVGLFGNGTSIAKEIQRLVLKETGLTCSIGVSFSKVFSKLGSDMNKPFGITNIPFNEYKQIVWPRPVEELLYIGPKTTEKLKNYGIHTIGALAAEGEKNLIGLFGKIGSQMYAYANGIDDSPVAHMDEDGLSGIHSIGNSTTAMRDLLDMDDAKVVIYMLAESVTSRLMETGYIGSVVKVGHRNNDDLMWHQKQQKLSAPVYLSRDIADTAMKLLSCYRWDKPLRGLEVRVSGLMPADAPRQLTLDCNAQRAAELEELERTMFGIRDRYGYKSIGRCFSMSKPELSGMDVRRQPVGLPGTLFAKGGVLTWNNLKLNIA